MQAITLPVGGFEFTGLSSGSEADPLVLFLHGFPQFADAWGKILDTVAAIGFHAVAVDQRGYSAGARPVEVEAYATDHLVADVLGFADALQATRFHLVGHDWGGFVAWAVAAKFSERLLSVTVLSTPHPAAFLHAVKTNPAQMAKSAYMLLFRAPLHAAEKVLLANGAAKLRAAYQGKVAPEQVEANVERLQQDGALTAALNWYRAMSLGSEVGVVKVPSLYLWSDGDVALGEAAALDTANYCKGPYRFENLAGRSHWLIDEAAEDVLNLLEQQLKTTTL